MDCPHCQTLLIEHHGGELAADVTIAVARHLAGCSECALEYCRLDADLSGIAPAFELEPAPSTFEALRERVRKEFSPPWYRRIGDWLRFQVPVYQAVVATVLLATAGAFTAVKLANPPAPAAERSLVTTPAKAATVFDNYDASELLSVDANIL